MSEAVRITPEKLSGPQESFVLRVSEYGRPRGSACRDDAAVTSRRKARLRRESNPRGEILKTVGQSFNCETFQLIREISEDKCEAASEAE